MKKKRVLDHDFFTNKRYALSGKGIMRDASITGVSEVPGRKSNVSEPHFSMIQVTRPVQNLTLYRKGCKVTGERLKGEKELRHTPVSQERPLAMC